MFLLRSVPEIWHELSKKPAEEHTYRTLIKHKQTKGLACVCMLYQTDNRSAS